MNRTLQYLNQLLSNAGAMSSGHEQPADKSILGGRFKVGKRIGSGTFGDLMMGKNITTGELVAIKLEIRDKPSPSLPFEYMMYMMLGAKDDDLDLSHGIPRIYHFCAHGRFNALVMDLLGPSLEDLRNLTGNPNMTFSLKSTIQVAIQLINVIEYVHSKKVIYRDNKPENYLFGAPDSSKRNQLHIIDFGLSKVYMDEEGRHIPYIEGKPIIGTARYMSINTHLLRETSRRDDMEAIGYILVYLIQGQLPWQGLKGCNSVDERYRRIGEVKRATPLETLCEGIPKEFADYLQYARDLEFTESPDYEYLRSLFNNVFNREAFTRDDVYDWTGKQMAALSAARPQDPDLASNVKIKGSRM